MYYSYDFCKKCNGKLIERNQTKDNFNEFNKSGDKCPICGELMILACVSKKKLDSIYQILLDRSVYEKCLKNTMMRDYIYHKSGMVQKESIDFQFIPFEGDATNTYKFMEFLDKNHTSYSVYPSFPIKRILYYDVCSTCGEPLVSKKVDVENEKDYVYIGKYCEKCKEWEFFNSFNKLSIDKTIYKIILDIDVVWDNKLLKIMQGLIGRENINCKKGDILIEDTALNIRSCGERLKAANIIFHIIPEFKYEIQPYEEVTEEILMEILKGQKWYKENDF